ncbi:MAG TPA: hypothetical protein VLE43_19455, partial [Candidatus Saccharimonadia bacterium]|nr:hypothetical protein [Candidatus Saccharimonadia bacterium]
MPKSAPPKEKTASSAKSPRSAKEAQHMMFGAVTRALHQNGMQQTWVDGSDMARYAELFIKPNDRLSSFDR